MERSKDLLEHGFSRPTHVRGSGIKMVNMKEIFSYDLISNVNMELVPVNDKELELMTLERRRFAICSTILSPRRCW
jgi:hypothetical protein